MPRSKAWRTDELRIGMISEFERDIGEDDVLQFANNSGDHNPVTLVNCGQVLQIPGAHIVVHGD